MAVPLLLSCRACIRFGALFSIFSPAQLLPLLVVCVSGFGVVRWCLILSFPWAHGIRRLVYCCARGVFCCCLLQQRAAVCGINFKIHAMRLKITILGQAEHQNITIFCAPLLRNCLSPVSSHDYPECKTPSKQYENGPITYYQVLG